MEWIVIGAFIGIVAFAIGIACGKRSPCVHETYLPPLPDFDTKSFRISSLETKILMLEVENKRLNRLYEDIIADKRTFHDYMMAHCYSCNKSFCAEKDK